MENITFIQITKQFEIQDIEKHLVFHFLKSNSISYTECKFIKDYLNDFCVIPKLLESIQQLKHNTIEEIAVDMELLILFDDRKENGAFFTPKYIVDFIINSIKPSIDAKIVDLSCGSGAFLLGIVRYMTRTFNISVSQCIKANVYGADILEYNIVRSKLLLSLLALSKNEVIEVEDMNLRCCDSLKSDWDITFDAVVGNPPYVKFQDMDDETRLFLITNYETTKFGTYNLYFAFFELGLRVLNKGGKLGYITPNNYFTSLAGESLRMYIQRTKCVYQIIDFNDTKVFDVQTYTAITFMNKIENSHIEYGRIEKNVHPQEYLQNIELTENHYCDLSEKKWRLLCGNERYNISIIENCGISIGNLFNICVGIATLKDEIYFINHIKEDDFYYYIERDKKSYKIEKEITRPLVKISDMKNITDIKQNTRHIIFPYKFIAGKANPILEEELKSTYPNCYNYFNSVKEILQGRGKGKHVYTPFYAYGRTQGLNRVGIKLLTPTFCKNPRFLLDENFHGFFTNGYGIYLRESSDSLFECENIAKAENLDIVQKILNSYLMEYYVDKTSVAIEGGYPCYQKNFIERFSIPHFTEDEIITLRSLSTPNEINSFLVDKYHLNLPIPNRLS